MKRTSDYFISDERENDPPEDIEGRARYEFARTAELAASLGGHPERAQDVERGLLEVAGLNKFELAA